jgi:hypothetical protein
VDRDRPSIYGTYLAINVVYATIIGKSPIGLAYLPSPGGGVTEDAATFLQRIAWETVQAYQMQPKAVCERPENALHSTAPAFRTHSASLVASAYSGRPSVGRRRGCLRRRCVTCGCRCACRRSVIRTPARRSWTGGRCNRLRRAVVGQAMMGTSSAKARRHIKCAFPASFCPIHPMLISLTNCVIFSSATGVFSWRTEMIIRAMGS